MSTTERSIAVLVRPNISGTAVQWTVLVLVLFLIAFPKGGVAAGGVAITWGYILLGGLAIVCAARLIMGVGGQIGRLHALCLVALIPFQLVALVTFMLRGAEHAGYTMAFIVAFFVVPPTCLVATSLYLHRVDVGTVLRWIRNAIRFIAIYGIFLFFFRLIAGYFIEIPFLTVNLADLGQLEEKYIDRGGVFKLISTYNNGNLYGICLLILLPLYQWIERSRLAAGTVKFTLLLTLSRTVWAGLILYELIYRIWLQRIGLRTLAVLSTSIAAMAVGIWWALRLMDLDLTFLFDAGLGGRIEQFQESFAILPHRPFMGIAEMVYLSVLDTFGMVGLAAFCLALGTPVLLFFLRLTPGGTSDYRRALVAGLIVYLFVAGSDGAILLIPVMALYWFVASLLLTPHGPRIENRHTDEESPPLAKRVPSLYAVGPSRP